MSEFKYDKDHLLDQTNGGLEVILRLYPEAQKAGKFQHFILRFRDEKTPSAIIIPLSKTGGVATVKDHGSGESYNCFDLVMQEQGLSFADACKWVASEMAIDGLTVQFNRPKLEFQEAEKGQEHGEYIFDYNEKLSTFELETLGPLVTQKDCEIFKLRSCKSFTQIKTYPKDHAKHPGKTMQIITKSTERYPILVFDFGEWQKIYQPLNADKQYRFRYAGNKPQNFVIGVDSLEDLYDERDYKAKELVKSKMKTEENYIPSEEETDVRFENIIIGSGDRDSINICSLGYPVVWQNSESAKLEYGTYKRLKDISKNVLYCGDLDDTGVKETVKLALDYIDIKIIWLPDWVKATTYRGKPRKDVTDFVKLLHKPYQDDKVKNAFERLVNTALPARFWDPKYTASGKFNGYDFNNEAAYRFLQYNGFYRYQEEFSKEDYSFIKVANNIVERVKFHEVANFPADYVRDTNRPIALLNSIHRSAQLTEKKLAALKQFQPDFSNSGKDFQKLFFLNKVWTVTKDEIKQESYKKTNSYVWKHNIIEHNVTVATAKNFKITHDGENFDIEIFNKNNHFLNYLINTSRVYWRKCGNVPFEQRIKKITEKNPLKRKQLEAEILADREKYREANKFNIAEEGLTAAEIQEQKDYLINKIFAFGYLLHAHKRSDRAWAVFAMDHKISDVNDSNGGSGKSIFLNRAITAIVKNYKYINGGDQDLIKSQFLMDGVTPETDYLIFDDSDKYFPFRKVFNNITGEFSVNPKFGKPFNLKFHESPKVGFTSNFGLPQADGSTLRRLLFVPFADYYHHKTDDDLEAYLVSQDFGKNLFDHFNPAEWNDFFNLAAECLQFYLGCETKVDPPLSNVNKRNSLESMGDAFKDWADVYFSRERINENTLKSAAFEDFEKATGLKRWSAQKFKKSIKEWCKYYGYIFNPEDLCGKDGKRIVTQEGEMIHIRTSHLEEDINKTEEDPADDFPI